MFPDDADGEALRRVASTGADMSRPVSIDYFVSVPDREAGEAVARLATRLGYRVEVVHDAEDDAWECYCSKAMLPTYDGVVAAQRELDELSRPFGGQSDGWGTSGNADNAFDETA
jgi:regulator of RNase E activity RraB